MSDERIAKQVLHWVPENGRKRGRLRVTWKDMVNKYTKKGGLTEEEAMPLIRRIQPLNKKSRA